MQVNFMVMQFKCRVGGNMMWVYLGKGKCMYFTFMQKKKHSNKICKYKSLHEINFIHNKHSDFVFFFQQHMHTYIFPFPLALPLRFSTADRCSDYVQRELKMNK